MTIGYNEAMPRTNQKTLNLRTRGYELFMKWQAVNGRHSIEEVAEKIGINVTTARRFIAETEDNVRHAELSGAWAVAKFFGVSLDELIYQGPDVSPDEKITRFKGLGKRGRPRKDGTQ